MHAGEEDQAQPGWTTSIRGQNSPWKSQSKWQKREITEINGESIYTYIRLWCGQPSDVLFFSRPL